MKERGVTFIELILVLAIMLTISILAPVFSSRFLLQNAVGNTVDQLAGSLRKAQMYSVMSKQGDVWSVHYSPSAITLYKGAAFAGHNSAFDETFSINSNVSISPNPLDVTFFRMTGTLSASMSATISSGTNIKTVTVNSQGVASK